MKLQSLFDTLSASMVGRDEEVMAILRALVAQEHIFLHGKPGTAKSFLVNNVAKAVSAEAYRILLTMFSTPEEVFGPNRLTQLKLDNYVRNTERRLPEAHIGFIDEIFKGSGAILNTLLTVMEERIFDNGGLIQKCPLRCLIAASNEFPETEQAALYDRFLIRRNVEYVPKHLRRKLHCVALPPCKANMVTMDELDRANDESSKIPFSQRADDAFLEMLEQLDVAGLEVSDRRAGKARKVAKAEAWMHGVTAVEPYHLEPLKDVFWKSLDDIDKVTEIVLRLSNPDEMIVNEWAAYISDTKDRRIAPDNQKEWSVVAGKLRTILTQTSTMRPSPKLTAIRDESANLNDQANASLLRQPLEVVRKLRLATSKG